MTDLNLQLATSATAGDLARVASLLDLGANPRHSDSLPICRAAWQGHADCVKLLISAAQAAAVGGSLGLEGALALAASNGHVECVNLLIPVSSPKAFNSQALREAAEHGHAECVKLLIPVSNPTAGSSRALREAAESGHAECVKLLIPVSDPKAEDSCALRWAARNGHAECVKLLIPVSDPRADDSKALVLAALTGQAECVRLLIPVSDADDTQALRHAATRGSAECVRLLAPASGALTGMEETLEHVIKAGHASILSILFAHEPRLFEGMDLAAILEGCRADGQSEIASLLRSIIEQQDLSGHISPLAGASHKPCRL